FAGVPLAVLVDADRSAIAARPAAEPAPAEPGALAYVMYTSGSTGRPKGVQVTVAGLGNLLLAMREELGLRGGVWLASTSVTFDISGLELYLPLVGGGTVVLAGDGPERDAAALCALITRHGVDHVQATPSGWKLLLDAGFPGTGCTALVGGEALPPTLAGTLRARVRRLVNVYGPTETTIWSSAWEVPPVPSTVEIGAPLRRTTLAVLDHLLRPVPVGVVGELHIGGTGLARGYAGRPDLTADRFIPDPSGTGERLYRTGDLARYTAGGGLDLLGRVDFQVKIRGHRIELGEIESALLAHPGVRDAAVVARPEPDGTAWLVAYLIPVGSPDHADLREFLGRSLPDYMIPGAFVPLAAWPLNSSGKLDRAALPAPARGDRAALAELVAPRTPVEERIAAHWREVLGLDRLGVHDGFFELGGDSLRAVALVGALRADGYAVTTRDVFRHQTVAALAATLTAPAGSTVDNSTVDSSPDAADPAPDGVEVLAGALRAAGIDIAADQLLAQGSVADLVRLLGQQSGGAATAGGDPQPPESSAKAEPVAPFGLVSEAERAALPAGVVDAYPTSQVQLGMIVESLLGGEQGRYHSVAATRIPSTVPFAEAALREAVDRVTARHEVLRTGFLTRDTAPPLQLVHETVTVPLRVDRLERGAAPVPAVDGIVAEERGNPLAADQAPLWRVRAVVEDGTAWWLVLTHSHAILDGWSFNSLVMELVTAYQAIRDGQPTAESPLPSVRYADFIAGELESLRGEADREYWRGLVTGAARLTVPAAWRDGTEDERRCVVPVADLEPGLRALARGAGTALKSVLLAAHGAVLSRLTEHGAFVTGLAVDARPEVTGADRVYGMHLNTVPFLAGRPAGSWRELVRRTFEQELAVLEHRRFPLPEIQRLAGVDAGERLLDVLFNYMDFRQVDTGLVDAAAGRGAGATEFALTVAAHAGRITLTARGTGQSEVDRLGSLYRAVLAAMAADPD
ncbi:MAG TPA: AMP-binding protein, partial [Rugosimonospora sp.]|nr:AMP-binding protein [Rugosimonospora sp.]